MHESVSYYPTNALRSHFCTGSVRGAACFAFIIVVNAVGGNFVTALVETRQNAHFLVLSKRHCKYTVFLAPFGLACVRAWRPLLYSHAVGGRLPSQIVLLLWRRILFFDILSL